jgi:hypothetical protein
MDAKTVDPLDALAAEIAARDARIRDLSPEQVPAELARGEQLRSAVLLLRAQALQGLSDLATENRFARSWAAGESGPSSIDVLA